MIVFLLPILVFLLAASAFISRHYQQTKNKYYTKITIFLMLLSWLISLIFIAQLYTVDVIALRQVYFLSAVFALDKLSGWFLFIIMSLALVFHILSVNKNNTNWHFLYLAAIAGVFVSGDIFQFFIWVTLAFWVLCLQSYKQKICDRFFVVYAPIAFLLLAITTALSGMVIFSNSNFGNMAIAATQPETKENARVFGLLFLVCLASLAFFVNHIFSQSNNKTISVACWFMMIIIIYMFARIFIGLFNLNIYAVDILMAIIFLMLILQFSYNFLVYKKANIFNLYLFAYYIFAFVATIIFGDNSFSGAISLITLINLYLICILLVQRFYINNPPKNILFDLVFSFIMAPPFAIFWLLLFIVMQSILFAPWFLIGILCFTLVVVSYYAWSYIQNFADIKNNLFKGKLLQYYGLLLLFVAINLSGIAIFTTSKSIKSSLINNKNYISYVYSK